MKQGNIIYTFYACACVPCVRTARRCKARKICSACRTLYGACYASALRTFHKRNGVLDKYVPVLFWYSVGKFVFQHSILEYRSEKRLPRILGIGWTNNRYAFGYYTRLIKVFEPVSYTGAWTEYKRDCSCDYHNGGKRQL